MVRREYGSIDLPDEGGMAEASAGGVELDGDDARAVLRAIERLTHGSDSFSETVCEVARSLVACDVATFNRIQIADNRVEYTTIPSHWQTRLDAYRTVLERFAFQHPLVDHHVGTGSPSAFRLSDVADAAWPTSDLYRGYYAPLGLRHQLILAVPSPSEVMNILALSRLASDFDERDVAVIDAVRPVLVLGCQTAALSALERPKAIAGGWVTVSLAADDTTVAAVTDIDPTGTFAVGRTLPAPARDLRGSGPSPLGAPRSFSHDGQEWLVRVISAPGVPRVLLVHQVGTTLPELPDLTPRQRAVAGALADGCSNREIAERLAITEPTVKKHLQRVYRALGVSSRSAAIARLRT